MESCCDDWKFWIPIPKTNCNFKKSQLNRLLPGANTSSGPAIDTSRLLKSIAGGIVLAILSTRSLVEYHSPRSQILWHYIDAHPTSPGRSSCCPFPSCRSIISKWLDVRPKIIRWHCLWNAKQYRTTNRIGRYHLAGKWILYACPRNQSVLFLATYHQCRLLHCHDLRCHGKKWTTLKTFKGGQGRLRRGRSEIEQARKTHRVSCMSNNKIIP